MEYLPAFDFFGSYLHFYVNHKKKVYTHLGGILSIISISICIFIFIILLKELIDRKNPQITENDYINREFKKIKFGEKKIYIPWTIGDYHNHEVNFTDWIYPIIYYFNERRDYKIINYTLCNETNLKNINYFFDEYLNLDMLYCIDMGDLIMGGDLFHDSVYYIQMDFFLCEDGVNIGTKGKKCTDYDKLMKYIGYNNEWHIEIYYPEIQFKPANKNNPMEIFYNTHSYNFNEFNTKIERLYLKEYTIIDDQGWIFKNKKNYTLWGFDKLEYDSYSRINNGKNFITDFTSSKIYSLAIYIDNNSKIYTRQYTKLLDALGNILSIINGIFVFFKFFSQFFTEAYQDKEIVNNVFVQKYFMNEKYNKINKLAKKQNYTSNLKYLILSNMISDPKIDMKNSISKSSGQVSKLFKKDNDIKPIMIKKKEEKSKFAPKLDTPKESIKNSKHVIQKLKLDDKSIKKLNVPSSDIDNSNMKLSVKRKSLIEKNKDVEFSLKTYELDKIKIYIKNHYKKDKNNKQLKKFSSTDFIFPYYLYLLNLFNKSFVTTKSCCVNQKFIESWEYMINVFDVTEFIKMQTNIDLINRILFELKSDGENNNISEI